MISGLLGPSPISAQAQSLEVSHYESGWYQSTNFRHKTNSTNYFAGQLPGVEIRSYLAFQIPDFSRTLQSVTLQVNSFDLTNGAITLAFFQVNSAADLVTGVGQGNDVFIESVYIDLGTGVQYGQHTIDTANTLVRVKLGASIVADINAAKNGKFVIGMASTHPNQGVSHAVFSNSSLDPNNKLIFNFADNTQGPAIALMESRSQLIMQNQPDMGRRLDRLNKRIKTNSLNGFGFTVNGSALPFSAELNENSARFAWSSRALRKPDEKLRVSADLGVLAHRLGARREVSQAASMLSAFSRTQTSQLDRAEQDNSGNSNRIQGNDPTEDPELRMPVDAVREEHAFAPAENPYDFWFEAKYSRFSQGDHDGDFVIFHGGVDYLLNDRLLLGLSGQFEWTEMENATSGNISGTGFMIGPYLTAKLLENAYFDARIAWGRANNRTSPFGTYSDTFGSDRWLATAALIGQINWYDTLIEPEVRLSWFNEQSEAYTDNLLGQIPSLTVERGTLEFGPTFIFPVQATQYGNFQWQFGIEGVWTFASENAGTTASTKLGVFNEGVTARTEAGITHHISDQRSASTFVGYDGIGDEDYEAWSIRILLNSMF